MRGTKLTITTRYVLLVGVLLFLANTVLGMVVLDQSKSAMRSLINKDMLDVVNSAAGSLDGDEMAMLTAADKGTPLWRNIEEHLLVFQESVDIEFIYAVKQVGPDEFVFTVDPDPVNPGAFGEEVLTTPALVSAGRGVPTVDESPAADRWGNFYSAFAPIYDSQGEVAGVVGVDFDATWYDAEVRKYTVIITTVTVASVLLGGLVMALITSRVRKRFAELNVGLSALSADVDLLTDEMASYSGTESTGELMAKGGREQDEAEGGADELSVLSTKINNMQREVHLYLEYLRRQAYTDSLTQVRNSTAYHERIDEIDQKIAEGTASFWVVVLDLNSLKQLNDTYGHECGDYYIRGAARSIAQGFEGVPVYRIGGDEFAVIVEDVDELFVELGLSSVEAAISVFNSTSEYPATLSVAHGVSHFVADEDTQFTEVFARADKIMYANKAAHYDEVGRGV